MRTTSILKGGDTALGRKRTVRSEPYTTIVYLSRTRYAEETED